MRDVISDRNITTLSNADAKLTPKEFYAPRINRKIATHEMGGVAAVNDFIWHLRQIGELKREEGTQEAITEFKSLMRGGGGGGGGTLGAIRMVTYEFRVL